MDAAKAAQQQFELAERTVSDLERPYIFLYPKPATITDFAEMNIEFIIHNSGRLPAVVYELHAEAGLAVCRPDELEYSKNKYNTFFEIIAQNESIAKERRLRVGEWLGQDGEIEPIIFGFVRYHDPLGKEYVRGFGFTPAGGSFSPHSGNIYNYDCGREEWAHAPAKD